MVLTSDVVCHLSGSNENRLYRGSGYPGGRGKGQPVWPAWLKANSRYKDLDTSWTSQGIKAADGVCKSRYIVARRSQLIFKRSEELKVIVNNNDAGWHVCCLRHLASQPREYTLGLRFEQLANQVDQCHCSCFIYENKMGILGVKQVVVAGAQ